jgi:membrane-bound inhibitor of C-type lysozyme
MWRSTPDPRGALRFGAAALALSTGCSPLQPRSEQVDIAKAARAAQQSIGNYAGEQEPTSPAPAPTIPDRIVATYRCDDSTGFRVTFDNQRDTATLALPGATVRLAGQRPASGIWYAGQGFELRGKGKAATLTRPGNPPITCRAAG